MNDSSLRDFPLKPSQPRMKPVGLSCSIVSLLLGMVAVGLVVWVSLDYFIECSRLPRGTGVRPMGVAFLYGAAGLGSWVIGLPFCFAGMSLCERISHTTGQALGGLGGLLCLLALPLGPILMCISDVITRVVQSP